MTESWYSFWYTTMNVDLLKAQSEQPFLNLNLRLNLNLNLNFTKDSPYDTQSTRTPPHCNSGCPALDCLLLGRN